MSAPTSRLVGRTCGNYVLRTVLDQGGVGMVFIAEHKFLGDRAAVKILHQGMDLEKTDMARRFFQEAKATRAIDHPNVVKIIDFGQDPSDGMLYLVMELLEGQSVAEALKKGPMPELEVARIGAAVADGLQCAHDKGVIHRDLKPGNIYLTSTGQVKMLDFGLAKVNQSGTQTAAGIVVGTPQYMAPEQVQQAKTVGPHTDIYGLGAVLFRMITGRLPFLGENMIDVVKQHMFNAPPRPSQFVQVSAEMETLILQCLEKEKGRRPASMAEVRNRLLQIREQRRMSAEMRAQRRSGEVLAKQLFDEPPKGSPVQQLASGGQAVPVVTRPPASTPNKITSQNATLVELQAPVLPNYVKPGQRPPSPGLPGVAGQAGQPAPSPAPAPAPAQAAASARVPSPVPSHIGGGKIDSADATIADVVIDPRMMAAALQGEAAQQQDRTLSEPDIDVSMIEVSSMSNNVGELVTPGAAAPPVAATPQAPSGGPTTQPAVPKVMKKRRSRGWIAGAVLVVVAAAGSGLLFYRMRQAEKPVAAVSTTPAPPKVAEPAVAPTPPAAPAEDPAKAPAPPEARPAAEDTKGAAPAEPAAAAAAPEVLDVQFDSEPMNATVFIDGVKRGVTPFSGKVKQGQEAKFVLDEYHPMRKPVTKAGLFKVKLRPKTAPEEP